MVITSSLCNQHHMLFLILKTKVKKEEDTLILSWTITHNSCQMSLWLAAFFKSLLSKILCQAQLWYDLMLFCNVSVVSENKYETYLANIYCSVLIKPKNRIYSCKSQLSACSFLDAFWCETKKESNKVAKTVFAEKLKHNIKIKRKVQITWRFYW